MRQLASGVFNPHYFLADGTDTKACDQASGPVLHDQRADPFALGESNGGELDAIGAFLRPPHNGLINPHWPLMIMQKE